jgi:hypothetical protein
MTSEEDKISGIPMLAKPFTRDELAILLEGRASVAEFPKEKQ